MAKYNKTTNVYKGLRVRDLKNYRGDGNLSEVEKVKQDFQTIFGNRDIDLNDPNGGLFINSRKLTDKSKELHHNEDLTYLIQMLQSDGFFDVISDKTNSRCNAINRAIDFNNKINFSKQAARMNASLADIKESYKNLQDMQANPMGKFMYIFDTETIGGKSKSNVWTPRGITEFAMQKVSLADPNNYTSTNIVLGIAPSSVNTKLYDTIEHLLAEGRIDDIMTNEEYRVTAMRTSLYGSSKTKLEFDSNLGYTVAKELEDANAENYLNLKQFQAGRRRLEDAYLTSQRVSNGLTAAEKAFLTSVAEMRDMAASNNAMIVGQNFMPFDMPVVNAEINNIIYRYQELANGRYNHYKIPSGTAKNALDEINQILGTNSAGRVNGFSIPKNNVFDTLPVFNAVRSQYGIDPLLNFNTDIIKAAAGGTARQEHIGAAWYPKVFESANAHMADFDVSVLRYMLTTNVDGQNYTLMQHMMEGIGGTGLIGIPTETHKIQYGTQLFHAKAGTRAMSFQGKGTLNFTQNSRTGEIFTSSNYEMIGNKAAQWNGSINMGTDIVKGQFYTVSGIQKISAADLPESLGRTIPTHSGPELYRLQMKMAVSKNHIGSGLEDLTFNYIFNSENELSGFLSSYFNMAASQDGQGNWVINGADAMELFEIGSMQNILKAREMGYDYINPNDIVDVGLSSANEKLLTDRAVRSITDSNKSYDKIKSQIKMRNHLQKAGINDVSKEEISLLLTGNPIRNMSQAEAEPIIKAMRGMAGFKPNGVAETKLYSNTVRNITSSWDFLTAQDPFLSQVISNLDTFARKNRLNLEQKRIMFNNVLEDLKTNVATQMYTDPRDVRNAVLNSKNYQGSMYDFKGRFEYELPSSFIIEEPKVHNVTSIKNLDAYRNVVSVDLNDTSSSFKLVNSLTSMKYGNRDLSNNPEIYKRNALTQFVQTLDKDRQFRDSGRIENAIKHITADPNGYSLDYVAKEVIEAMKGVKEVNPGAGIIRDIAVRSFDINQPFVNNLNQLSSDVIRSSIQRTSIPVDLTGKDIGQISNYVKSTLLPQYIPSRSAFETSLEGLSKTQVKHMNILYDTLENDVLSHLTDIVNISSQVKDSVLSYDAKGLLTLTQGSQAVTFNSIPKIGLDNGVLFATIGNEEILMHLDQAYDAAGNAYNVSNLGILMGRNKHVSSRIKNRIETGDFKLQDLKDFATYVTKEVREQAKYTHKSGDRLANYYVGTANLDAMLPRIFGGDLHTIGDDLQIPENVKQILREEFARNSDIKPGELDPILGNLISSYRFQIAGALPSRDMAARFVIDNTTTATKDKSKLSKGIGIGGGIRFETSAMTLFDNNARPPLYGSGNVYYLAAENVKATAEKAFGPIYEGSLFETSFTNKLNRTVNEVGELTTSFTSRVAYVGQGGIEALINNNFDKIMASNTIEFLNESQKQNVYNMTKATINTFEQQKIFNAQMFDSLTNGTMAANVQRLSTSKDLYNAITEDNIDKFKNLLNLMGDIDFDSNGVISYKSKVGQIVKRGEAVIPYSTYGGGISNFTSKMHRGLLNFTVRDKEGMILSDKQISKVLNKHISKFEGIDRSNKSALLGVFSDIFSDYDTAFTIEDVNKITLPKILINDSEKSMNHLLRAKAGSVNKNIANVFKAYSPETAELVGKVNLTPQSFAAYFSDSAKLSQAISAGNFSTVEDFISALSKEEYVLNELVFGKHGLLPGFSAIGNDNLLGHGNKGSMMVGALGEAVTSLGKYYGSGTETNVDRIVGLNKFTEIYNFVDAQGNRPYQFFTSNKGQSLKLSVVNGHLQFDNGIALSEKLDNYDIVDTKKLESFFRQVDTSIKTDPTLSVKASVEEGFVHMIPIKNKQGIYEDKEFIGRYIYENKKIGDEYRRVASISVGQGTGKFVIDPETQSSMTQDFIDKKKDLMQLKSQQASLEAMVNTGIADKTTTDQLKAVNEQINNLQGYIADMSSTGHLMRMGDQERNVLKNYRIDEAADEAIKKHLGAGHYSQDALNAIESLKGIDKSKYSNYHVFDFLETELKNQIYFNPYEEAQLTKEMLETSKYSHLKGIYKDVLGNKKAPALGAHSAQTFYDLQSVEMAQKFNNRIGNITKDDLIERGFEVMSPKDYINTFGDTKSTTYESLVNKNVLIDLGKDFGSDRYVAVPGMGTVLEDAEIKKNWHKQAQRLVNVYQDDYLGLHGNAVNMTEVMTKVRDIRDDIAEATAGYLKKNDTAHLLARQQIYAATDRVKILTTMNTADNPLLQRAMVDGKSIAAWAKEGIHYDYSFDSLESFEERGFFKAERLKRLGMTREDMIKHLQTHGTVMIDDRYPNIIDTSLVPTRHYLNMDFQASNSALMSPVTALKLNADSDGDSVSRFMVKHKSMDYTDYQLMRNKAVQRYSTVGPRIQLNDMTAEAREAAIRQATIDAGMDVDVYDAFRGLDIKMAQAAVTENVSMNAKVQKKWAEDNEKILSAQAIKGSKGSMQSELSDGLSTLAHTKLPSLSEDPSLNVIRTNAENVNNLIKQVQDNAQYLPDAFKGVSSISTIEEALDETKTLDMVLGGLEELHRQNRISSTDLGNAQEAIYKRVRIGTYQAEAMSKTGIAATGNVNATLYGISQVAKDYWGVHGTESYDQIGRDIISKMAYEMEQAPISSKKVAVKAGDTRLYEFTRIFKDAKKEGMGSLNVEGSNAMRLQDWMYKYMDEGKIANAYDLMVESSGISDPLTESTDKVKYMVENFIQDAGYVIDKQGGMRADVDIKSSFGRRSANARALSNASGNTNTATSFAGNVIGTINGEHNLQQGTSKAIQQITEEERARRAAQDAISSVVERPSAVEGVIESASNTISKISSKSGIGTALTMGVVGLASGLIAAGYASGNPLNDANPETVTQQSSLPSKPQLSFGNNNPGVAPNNTGGYIININGDTRKGNRQLKRALKQAANSSVGGATNINMNIRSSNEGGYTDRDIEHILNDYF